MLSPVTIQCIVTMYFVKYISLVIKWVIILVMKRAVLLHGTDGKPDDQWFPWLKTQLEASGYEVFSPLLPHNHTPNRNLYESYLKKSGWDFSDNIIVGHSSGATTALNLLLSDWFPRVKATVLVGTFLNEKLTKEADWFEEGQFKDLFLDDYRPKLLKNKSQHFYFVHGDNDPYCDIEDARKLCGDLDGEFIEIKDGQHLSNSSEITELPDLLAALQKDGML